jgi:hypothetical protein
MDSLGNGSPGSHPHSDRPNWQPGDDDAADLLNQKIRDAINQGKSERQIAKLLGLTRTEIWRWKLMAAIPKPLLDRLMKAGSGRGRSFSLGTSTKALAAIGRALKDGELRRGEVERCPHCGEVIRVRPDISKATAKIVADYLAESEGARIKHE